MELKIVKEKLQELKMRDKNFIVFGSRKHLYKNNPVSYAEIERFENNYNFTLPEGFRTFLIEIGYGAGPYYGIRNLNEISEYIENWFMVDYFDSPIQWLSWVFGKRQNNPFSKDRKQKPEKPFPLKQEHIDKINEQFIKNEIKFENDFRKTMPFPCEGIIQICHPGCHFETVLVTSGELRGSVWNVECDGKHSSWIPAEFKKNPKTFENINFEVWYEDWLNFNLAQFIKR